MNRIILRIGCFFILIAAAFPPVLNPGASCIQPYIEHNFILNGNRIVLDQYAAQVLVTAGLTLLAAWAFAARKTSTQSQTPPRAS